MAEAETSHWAVPGARCVCILDLWDFSYSEGRNLPHRIPMLGEVLTVRSVRPGGEGWVPGHPDRIYLAFHDIPVDQSDEYGTFTDIFWCAENFRPLVEGTTSIEIFKAMLNPSKTEVTA